MKQVIIVALSVAVVCGCTRTRQYELKGQVLAVDNARREVTIRHEDIRGFMPGMTMPFKVSEPKLLDGIAAGDLVTATLVVGDNEAHLSTIARTGHASLPPGEPVPAAAHILEPGAPVPDVALVDESGAPRHLSEWKGRTLVVTFVYTRCPLPEFCPRMDRNFAEVQRAIGANPRLRDRVHLLSVSFDPEYDTPAVLREHARRVGADPATWTYATGERDAIDAFGKALGMSVFRDDLEKQQIVHNLRTAVVGGDGRLVTIFNGNDWATADLLAVLGDATR
jgi:protein SCO1/2